MHVPWHVRCSRKAQSRSALGPESGLGYGFCLSESHTTHAWNREGSSPRAGSRMLRVLDRDPHLPYPDSSECAVQWRTPCRLRYASFTRHVAADARMLNATRPQSFITLARQAEPSKESVASFTAKLLGLCTPRPNAPPRAARCPVTADHADRSAPCHQELFCALLRNPHTFALVPAVYGA